MKKWLQETEIPGIEETTSRIEAQLFHASVENSMSSSWPHAATASELVEDWASGQRSRLQQQFRLEIVDGISRMTVAARAGPDCGHAIASSLFHFHILALSPDRWPD